MIYFRNKKTSIPSFKIKLNGVELNATSHVKYVGITLNEHLTFKRHITLLNAKLKRANNLIAISRHYLTKKLLLQIYYGQFYSHLSYGCQLWGQNSNAIKQTISLQKKAIRLMSFAHYQDHSSPLFKSSGLLKLVDVVQQNNMIFTHNVINGKTPSVFSNYFSFAETNHEHQTVNNLSSTYSLPTGSLELPDYRTEFGKSSIKCICSTTWNSLLKDLSLNNTEKYNKDPFWINNTSVKLLKNMLKEHFLEQY